MKRILLVESKLIPQPARLSVCVRVRGNAIKRSVRVYCCESTTSIIRLTAPRSHNRVASTQPHVCTVQSAVHSRNEAGIFVVH
jgi:hypothetical protein